MTPTSSKGSPSPVPKYLDMQCDFEHIRCGSGDCDCDTHDDDGNAAAMGAGNYEDQFVCNGYEIPLQHETDCGDNDDEVDEEDDEFDRRRQNGDDSNSHRMQFTYHIDNDNDSSVADAAVATQQQMQHQLNSTTASPTIQSSHLTQSQRRRDLRQRNSDKERTFSSSSTVSEHTVFPTGDQTHATEAASITDGTARLLVVLPLEECSSRETLLQHKNQSCSTNTAATGTATNATPTATIDKLGRRGSQRRRSGRQKQNSLKRPPVFGCTEAKTIM